MSLIALCDGLNYIAQQVDAANTKPPNTRSGAAFETVGIIDQYSCNARNPSDFRHLQHQLAKVFALE